MKNRDFTDIVFSSRNKDYGAYTLRKNYKKYLSISLIIALFCGCTAVLIPFFKNTTRIYQDAIFDGPKHVELSTENLNFPKEKISSAPSMEMMTLMPVIDIDRPLTSGEKIKTDDQIYPYNEINNSANSGLLESRPSFQGGDLKKFLNWVLPQIKYPPEAIKSKAQGSFKIFFVIEKDGSISNVKVESDAARSIEMVIKKVVLSSPKWSPGIKSGKPVRVQCEFPLIFTIR